MNQIARQTAERPQAYWETIRDRIDTATAVGVLNKLIKGKQYKSKDITVMQATMAWNIVNKMLPSLQAVALRVEQADPLTRHDLDALMLSTGIDPSLIDGYSEDKPLITKDNGKCIDTIEDSVSVEKTKSVPE